MHSKKEELGRKAGIATDLNNIGSVYYVKGEYNEAIPYFEKAVALLDSLRLTAKGDIRRDYLASRIGTYQFLTASYFQSGSFRLVFNAVEAASCKYLVEQMQGKLGTTLETFDMGNYQKKIPVHTAVVSFTNVEWSNSLAFAVDRNGVSGAEIRKKEFISTIANRYETSIAKASERTRGLTIKEKGTGEKKGWILRGKGKTNLPLTGSSTAIVSSLQKQTRQPKK